MSLLFILKFRILVKKKSLQDCYAWDLSTSLLRLLLKKFRRRVTLCPLVRVWLRRTGTIPWVWVSTMGVENTVSSFHYHDACLYHESLSMPLVHVYTMSPCLYHETMCIPWDLVNSMHPCLYHESLLITWVNVYNMSPEIQLTKKEIKYKNTIVRYTNNRSAETQIQEYRNKSEIVHHNSKVNTPLKSYVQNWIFVERTHVWAFGTFRHSDNSLST